MNDFENKFNKEFGIYPNYLSLLTYDLVGLIYYLTINLNSDVTDIEKLFKKKIFLKEKLERLK